MDKEQVRQFGYELGADAVGFAAIEDYQSPKSPDPITILPNVKSIIVLGYRELNGSVKSENTRVSMASRMGGMEFSLKNSYLVARYIEDRCQVKAAPVSFSYPLDMAPAVMGFVGDVSMRHAAVAAGLGSLADITWSLTHALGPESSSRLSLRSCHWTLIPPSRRSYVLNAVAVLRPVQARPSMRRAKRICSNA